MGCSPKSLQKTDDLNLDTPNHKDYANQKYINTTFPKKSMVNYGNQKIMHSISQLEIQLWVQGPTPLQILANIDDSVISLKSILSISRKFQGQFYGEEINMDGSTIKTKKVSFSSKIEVNQFINNKKYRRTIVDMKFI